MRPSEKNFWRENKTAEKRNRQNNRGNNRKSSEKATEKAAKKTTKNNKERKRKMKRFLKSFVITLLLLMGITFVPSQKAGAEESMLSVNNKWSQTIVSSEKTTYYKFVVPSDGLLTWQVLNDTPNIVGSDRIYSYILDDNMISLRRAEASPGGKTSSESIVLSAGTYYLQASYNGSNSVNAKYKIRLNHTSYGVNDQKASSYYSPQTIKLGGKIVGALTETDREDWYKIKISKAGTYVHTVIAMGKYYVTLFSENLVETLNTSYIGGSTEKYGVESLSYELDAGTYYIRISPCFSDSVGKYEFTIAAKACSHTYKTKVVKPTYFSKGYTIYTCSKCGNVVNKNVVGKRKVAQETVKKLTAGKKKMTVTWKTISDVTGYQIRYTTDKNFKKSIKTVTVKGKSISKKDITKLKSKKTYYVQVRAYATKSGTTVYGKWSKTKNVKVK